MNSIDLLILDGPPAAGKSSLAKTIAAQLQASEIAHAVIEMDDLAKIYPLSLLNIMYKNLAKVWPNYEALGPIKIIITTYMQAGERKIVMNAAPALRTTICEVIVPYEESAYRIAHREADEVVRQRLLRYLDGYDLNRTPPAQVDFTILNVDRSLEDSAAEVIRKIGWLA